MSEYEYKVEPWSAFVDEPRKLSEFVQDGLNQEANRGWRTISVFKDGYHVYVVFEREREGRD